MVKQWAADVGTLTARALTAEARVTMLDDLACRRQDAYDRAFERWSQASAAARKVAQYCRALRGPTQPQTEGNDEQH